MSCFVISCGGTGGHLSPGIALAERLTERGHRCCLIISRKSVDVHLVKKYPDLMFVKCPGIFFSWTPFRLIKFFFQQISAFIFAMKLLYKLRPDVIIGFGGFITGGVTLAGYCMLCPIVFHEANRVPGKATRYLSAFARRIYLPEGVFLRGIHPKPVRHTGCPVRREIYRMDKKEARKALGIDVNGKLLLVLGGSQGASVLNNWAIETFKDLAKEGINVFCLTGLGKGVSEVIECSSIHGSQKAYFRPFSDQMAEVLSSADLAISRAGAGSIAELIRTRLPAILIPYPYAADNHQWVNAHFFERQGCGILFLQKDLLRLQDEVVELIFNDWMLKELARNLKRLDHYDCLDFIVQDLETLAVENRPILDEPPKPL